MGFFQRLLEAFGLVKKPAKLIVVGLDNSGKTTLINHLKTPDTASYDVVPTVGFQEEHFDRGNIRFTVFDMSGADTYRSLWEKFYADVNGIIFVVDSADSIRMCVAKDELDALLAHPDMRRTQPSTGNRCPIVVFSNKADLPNAMDASEVSVMLGLTALKDRAWHIQASNALNGDGVDDGVRWLASQLNRAQAAASAGPAKASSSSGAGATGGK